MIRGADGVLRNRGEYDTAGNMVRAQPMSADEFRHGAAGDELRTVFLNGKVVGEQTWFEVSVARPRARVFSPHRR